MKSVLTYAPFAFCMLLAILLPTGNSAEPLNAPLVQTKAKTKAGHSPQRLARMGSTHLRHAGRIFHLAFSPDGKLMSTAGQTGVVRFWDVKTGRLVREISTGDRAATGVFFPPDGKYVMISTLLPVRIITLGVYDLGSGKELRRFRLVDAKYSGIRFSRDGHVVVAADEKVPAGKGVGISVWDTKTAKRIARRRIDEKDTYFADLSPDGKLVCLWKKDGTIILQETTGGKEIRRLPVQELPASAVTFSSDGELLAAAGAGMVYIWRTKNGREFAKFKAGSAYTRQILFGAGGKSIILNEDKSIGVFAVASGKRLLRFPIGPLHFLQMCVTPDGGTLAAFTFAEVTARLWNLHTGKEITPAGFSGHRYSAGIPSFSPDGRRVATIDYSGAGHVWDAATGKDFGRLEGRAERIANHPVFFDNGRKILAGDDNGIIHIWDTATRKLLRTWPTIRAINGLALSPNKRTVAFLHSRRRVSVWQIAKGKLLKTFFVPEDRVDALRYFPDGVKLVLGCTDEERVGKNYTHKGVVRLWDIARDKEIAVWRGFKGYLWCLAVAPDGRTVVAAGGKERSLRLIEVSTGKERGRIGQVSEYPSFPMFSPDGRLLALSTHYGLELWDVATGKKIWQTRPLSWRSPMPVFSPDGRVLAAGWSDGLVETWKLPNLPKESPLSKDALTKHWNELASADARAAWRAVWRLALTPQNTLPFLKKHLQPVRLTESRQKQLDRWIADLNDPRFRVRGKSTAELRKAGDASRPQLKKALARTGLSLEMRQRLAQLLDQVERTPPEGETLRAFRALEVLENIGSSDARKIAARMTSGTAGMRVMDEAIRCLRRWK